MLTIFTPIYNRAYIIHRLYKSLCRQTSKDFEWLIINDGSTDNIDELISQFLRENKIKIRYYKQENGGKHQAINRGVKEATGSLFFIVDSDDYLTDNAVEWISRASKPIIGNTEYAGLSGIRINPNGVKIGGGDDFGIIDATAIDIRYKHGVTGDLAEVYKTEILKKYPFPKFNGEKFCTEALVWFRIARNYKLKYFYKGIYVCEYQPDGLTAKMTCIRHSSPQASMTFYAEHFHDKIPFKWKIKAAINYWRFKHAPYQRKHKMLSPLSLMCFLPGKIMSIKDRKK